MIDGASKTDREMMSGRTDSGKIVNFRAPGKKPGEYVNVKITRAKQWSLEGELL